MIVEKMTVQPVEVPVASIQVTQRELDLLTALINECNTDSSAVDVMQMYNALAAAGGRVAGVKLRKTGIKSFDSAFTVDMP